MGERDITGKQEAAQSQPQDSHGIFSILDGVEKNAVAPLVNGFAVEPINAGINVLNGISDAGTWIASKVSSSNYQTPEISKLGTLAVGNVQDGSLGYYSQKVFGMGGQFLAYAAAGKLAGKALGSASELAPIDLEVGNFKLGATIQGLGKDARVAQVIGATAYAGLKDPTAGESRLSNAASTFIGFSAFEAGNSFIKPGASALSRFGQRYAVGMVGGVAQTETSSLLQNHTFASQDAFNSTALSGGLLNALLPYGAKITDGIAGSLRFSGLKGDPGMSFDAKTTPEAKEMSFAPSHDAPEISANNIAIVEPAAAGDSSSQPVPAELKVNDGADPNGLKTSDLLPPKTVPIDFSRGNFATVDPLNQRITVTETDGAQRVLSTSAEAMTPVKGSQLVADNMWRSPDGKTQWYRSPDGYMTRADSDDWGLRYGDRGIDVFDRNGWVTIDTLGRHLSRDGENWDATNDPNVWTRFDGSTLTIRDAGNESSTLHWHRPDGTDRLIDAHGAEWFKGDDQPWREVGTWDSHTNYERLGTGDRWTDGNRVLFRDIAYGRYWHGTKGGALLSDDGSAELQPDGKIKEIKVPDTTLPRASDAVQSQLDDLQAKQNRLRDLPVDKDSIQRLSDGGMGHDAYSLNLVGPDGPQKVIFRAVEGDEPGLKDTRMRKDLAAQNLSARLFEKFPSGVQRDIEINGVMRKGWVQDASVFSDQRVITDLQNHLHDLSGQALANEAPGVERLRNFLEGKSADPAMSAKGLQIRNQLEQVFVERMIFGDMDNHALNFVADFDANPPMIRHIDLDKAFRVHANEPSLALNNLNESGLGDLSQVFSNTKLSAATQERLNEFVKFYDSPAGQRQMASEGLLTEPAEASAVIARARWLRDHGTFPQVKNLFAQHIDVGSH